MSAAATFVCLVLGVYDGDGPFYCASGEKLRVAGVQAADFTRATPCRERPIRRGYVCDDVLAAIQRDRAASLVTGQRLDCRKLRPSYDRVLVSCRFADGRNLATELVRVRAASWWR